MSQTHRLHVAKLATGFSQLGFRSIVLNDFKLISELGKNDIVYISNHFTVYYPNVIFSKQLVGSLFKAMQSSAATFLLWSGLDYAHSSMLELSNVYVLLDCTDKRLRVANRSEKTLEVRYCSSQMPNTLRYKPVRLRRHDVYYVGSRYDRELCLNIAKAFPNSFIRQRPPIVGSIPQTNRLMDSKLSLGFFGASHKDASTYTERLPEALAAGCIMIHNHPNLPESLNALPSLIYCMTGLNEFLEKISFLLSLHNDSLDELCYESWDYYNKNPYLSYFGFAQEILTSIHY